MSHTIMITEEMVSERCAKCDMRWMMPAHFVKRRREDKQSFYCPQGHILSYSESDADRLRRDLDRERQNKAYLEDQIKCERERAEASERSRAALAGQITRLKKRASAGVCPCCSRTFENLARHMKTKHSDFIAEPIEDSNIVPIKKATP